MSHFWNNNPNAGHKELHSAEKKNNESWNRWTVPWELKQPAYQHQGYVHVFFSLFALCKQCKTLVLKLIHGTSFVKFIFVKDVTVETNGYKISRPSAGRLLFWRQDLLTTLGFLCFSFCLDVDSFSCVRSTQQTPAGSRDPRPTEQTPPSFIDWWWEASRSDGCCGCG